MTDQEWLQCTDPTSMLEFLHGKISDRKLRLLATGCCRRVWHLLTDERSRKAVEIGEKYADGEANSQERERAYQLAYEAFLPIASAAGWYRPTHGTPADVLFVVDQHASYAVVPATMAIATVEANVGEGDINGSINPFLTSGSDDPASEAIGDRLLLLDIFFNPFRPLPRIVSAWLTWNGGTVVKIAQGIYDDRAFHQMPILADALEDAGCDNEDILNHCRSAEPHVKGCWVVDLLLGKE